MEQPDYLTIWTKVKESGCSGILPYPLRKGSPVHMSIPDSRGSRRRRRTTTPKTDDNSASVFNIGSHKPFLMFAEKYLDAGWHPIILPTGKKAPPPSGFTGRFDGIAGLAQFRKWADMEDENGDNVYDERSNLGFRAPRGVLGIDVDDYAGSGLSAAGVVKARKIGGTSLRELEAAFGKLPETWTSTARADNVSGIRWFRVPENLEWPGKIGNDIESVWYKYRFAVAPPSLHPDLKLPYLWYAPGEPLDGSGSMAVIPDPAELVDLPEAWIDGLQKGEYKVKHYDDSTSRKSLREWILARPKGRILEDAEGNVDPDSAPVPCTLMRKAAEDAVGEIDGAGSAHEKLNIKLNYILNLAAEGHAGLIQALGAVRAAFIDEVTNKSRAGSPRSTHEAVSEYDRNRDGAVRLILGTLQQEQADTGSSTLPVYDECSCYIPLLDEPEEAEDPFRYEQTELGNAYHISDLNHDSIRFITDEKRFAIWDRLARVWYYSDDEKGPTVERLAQLASERMMRGAKQRERLARDEAEKAFQQEGADEIQAAKKASADVDVKRALELKKWAKTCQGFNNVKNSINQLKALPSVGISGSKFDADTSLLQFNNGILDISSIITSKGRKVGTLRPADRDDYLLRFMKYEYNEEAMSGPWEDFLTSAVPDSKVREYLHRLAGYSLLAENMHKKIVFLLGPTNSGKSTFIEVMQDVFGGYGRAFDLTMFREKREEGARPDLLAAMKARFIGSSETSEMRSLHVDTMKRLSGSDTISARAMRSDVYHNMVPAFVPWIATNEIPSMATDKALRGRIEPIVFPTSHETRAYPEGGSLKGHLLANGGGEAITGWLVDGLRKFARHGLGNRPESVMASVEEFSLDASGHLGDFVREYLKKADVESYVPTADIAAAYSMWCSTNDIRDRLNALELGKKLTKMGWGNGGKKRTGANKSMTSVRIGVQIIGSMKDA